MLPILWLVTLVHWPMESPAAASTSSISATADLAPAPGHTCPFHDDYVCSQSRRSGGERGQVAPRLLEPISLDISMSPRVFALAIPLTGDSLALPQCWQFLWRTVGCPRAPSFLA